MVLRSRCLCWTKRQLIADSLGVDEYTYDGCGKVISLSEHGEKDLNSGRLEPILIVGHGKKLRLVNVKIKVETLFSFYLSYLCNLKIVTWHHAQSKNSFPSAEAEMELSCCNYCFTLPFSKIFDCFLFFPCVVY